MGRNNSIRHIEAHHNLLNPHEKINDLVEGTAGLNGIYFWIIGYDDMAFAVKEAGKTPQEMVNKVLTTYYPNVHCDEVFVYTRNISDWNTWERIYPDGYLYSFRGW